MIEGESVSRSIGSILHLAWRLLVAVVGMTVLVGVIAWMSGTFRTKVEPVDRRRWWGTTAGIASAVAETIRTPEHLDAVGTVEPRRKVSVASLLLGTILEVKVNAGDRVDRGQLLVTLDDREILAQLHEAEAAVAAASADLATRERDYERYQQLYKANSVTGSEYDRAKGAYQVAVAQQHRAQEQARRLEVMLSYTRIEAPSAGIVADRFADPGDLAAPGKPILALHDPKERDLHASVREGLARFIRPGMTLAVHIDAASLDVEGVVREIVPMAVQASRTVLVKVSLPTDKVAGLYNGMFGRIAVPVGQTERLVVPAGAVHEIGQLDVVYVLVGAGRERRFVRTGRTYDGRVEILSGLSAGERVTLPSAPAAKENRR